ncbi:MAG: OmpA family protein [Sphingobacteriia bacterium]|nr:OmpA family protein [Sphingobacteriia bacterium]
MAGKESKNNIIIKKIKKVSGGHHGGAWKVAYADFVTAMMAFFLLLWLLSSAPQEVLKGIAEYFTPTIGIKGQEGIGFNGGTSPIDKTGNQAGSWANNAIQFGAPTHGNVQRNPEVPIEKDPDSDNFISFEQSLKSAIQKDETLKEFSDQILISMTPDGLEITLIDKKNRPIFAPGTANLMPYAKNILEKVGEMVKFMPNFLAITGYTTSASMPSKFDAWALSSDRANSARSYLESTKIDADQMGKIVGKADRELINASDPNAPENIRLSLTLLKNSVNPYKNRSLSAPVEFSSGNKK